MKSKIEKALGVAVSNLSNNVNWLRNTLKCSAVEILATFQNEKTVAERISYVQTKVKSFKKPYYMVELKWYDDIYDRYVELGDFILGFDYFINGYLEYEWHFIGDRKNGIKRICFVQLVDNEEVMAVYDLPLKAIYECDDIYRFANDVLQAFIIEPHLFEVFYDFQVLFFGNDKDIQYNVEYLAEYERIDV